MKEFLRYTFQNIVGIDFHGRSTLRLWIVLVGLLPAILMLGNIQTLEKISSLLLKIWFLFLVASFYAPIINTISLLLERKNAKNENKVSVNNKGLEKFYKVQVETTFYTFILIVVLIIAAFLSEICFDQHSSYYFNLNLTLVILNLLALSGIVTFSILKNQRLERKEKKDQSNFP